jgi:hypothetical protein
MGTGAIGSTSFWQQDQNFWQQAQSNDSTIAATNSVINAMSAAETSEGKGLASIANKSALNRVNSQLVSAIQSILDGGTGSTSSSASSSSSSAGTPAAPAIGTGTQALTTSTSLSTLGVLAGGTITVSSGAYTTTYTSTGNDTVGDFMQAVNTDLVGNAPVTASLSSTGRLVLTGKNTTNMILVGGVYASNIGFGVNNNSFKPTKGTPASTPPATTSTASSSTAKTSTASTAKSYTTVGSEISSSAASLLSDSGAGGSLVDMLA